MIATAWKIVIVNVAWETGYFPKSVLLMQATLIKHNGSYIFKRTSVLLDKFKVGEV